ncbi:MAG: SDR family NAD-dependent epimerase/dehydratase, partial [Bacteroidetes bacterium]|nr:SDR family NAD-dependent epimerase/dehydratase [Bacteroidota bacterium]
SFCYVSDLIDGIYRLLLSDEWRPVNIGNPHEISLLEFVKEIIALSGTQSNITFKPLPQDDPKQRQPDISRAKQLLGWEPKITREQGLALTYEYFTKQLADFN